MIICEDRALEAVKEALVLRGSAGPVRIELCFSAARAVSEWQGFAPCNFGSGG